MLLDLDTAIFIGFLAINLIVGLFYSRGIKNVKEYAIGKGFSTSTIATTIIATYMGASFFTTAITESYRQGLYFIIPILGEPIALIITGWVFIPRMKEFIGQSSVAEVIGKFYGKPARIITAICGMFFATGICALQFKVAAQVLSIFFNISSFYMSIFAASIIILYSAFGGIRSVTFTDILQFFTFTAVLPLIFITIWRNADQEQIINTLSISPLFDLSEIFDLKNPRIWSMVSFCLILAFHPSSTFNPAAAQRISMSRNTHQAQKSFIVAGLISIVLLMIVCGTSVALFSSNPNLDPNQLLTYIINNYTFTGLRGLTAICLMALIMSTADSYLNSSAVLLTNDIVNVLKPKSDEPRQTLFYLRFSGLVIGFGAFILSYKTNSLFDILMITLNFYTPIVCAPLFLAIFGFYSSSRVVLMAMAAGLITSVLTLSFWKEYWGLPGMLANLIIFILAHFILGKPKGYSASSKGKHGSSVSAYSLFNSFNDIKNFHFLSFLEKLLPYNKSNYIFILLLSFLSLILFTYTLNQSVSALYRGILNITDLISITIISTVSTYVISPFFNHKKYLIGAGWLLCLGYLLLFVPGLFVLMGQFTTLSLLMFMVNIMAFLFLVPWQASLPMIGISTYSSIKVYSFFISTSSGVAMNTSEMEIQFKMIGYLVLLVSSIVLAFLKPKQEAAVLSEEKIDHLAHAIEDQNKEISHLSGVKNLILRNLQHETNTPLTGIYSMSQALSDCYSKLSEEQRIKAIDSIKTSSERLVSYVHNLVDVSKLITQKYKLDIRTVHVSILLKETIEKCKRLYVTDQDEEDLEIALDIEPNIAIKGDEYLIKRSFENMIINAIQYCKKGLIEIKLHNEGEKIILYVKDSGIGIPQEELSNIFEPFTVSSKTITPAGGRGLGLAFVKEAASIHGGSVTAQSDGSSGSCFVMTIRGLSIQIV